MTLQLTIAVSDNPQTRPLKHGSVKPKTIELDFITFEPGTRFHCNLFYDEFDVSKMSISETSLARERTDGTKWVGPHCRCF